MSDQTFYELCYDQYSREMQDVDSIYQRSGSTMFALPILFAAFYALGRTDLLPKWSSRIDILLYHIACVLALALLSGSVALLVLAVYPRKYKTLASMKVWQEWRKQYNEHLRTRKEQGREADQAALEQAMIESICPRLAEAQAENAAINEKRRKYWKLSILLAAIGMVAIGLQAVMTFVLRIQGI